MERLCTAYHGLSAYSGIKEPLAIVRAAQTIQADLENSEVCVADRPIGPIGVVLSGPIRKAFPEDVWSKTSSDGQRSTEWDAGWMGTVENPSDDAWHAFCQDHLVDRFDWDENSQRHYCEAWMSHPHIVGIWVKGWADERTHKVARVLAKRYSASLMTVDGTTRIWETHGSLDVRYRWTEMVDPDLTQRYEEMAIR